MITDKTRNIYRVYSIAIRCYRAHNLSQLKFVELDTANSQLAYDTLKNVAFTSYTDLRRIVQLVSRISSNSSHAVNGYECDLYYEYIDCQGNKSIYYSHLCCV